MCGADPHMGEHGSGCCRQAFHWFGDGEQHGEHHRGHGQTREPGTDGRESVRAECDPSRDQNAADHHQLRSEAGGLLDDFEPEDRRDKA